MRGVIASIFVGLLAVSPAHADDVERAAQVHLDRGVAAYGAGDWRLAQKELEAAVDLVPHKPNPYRWLALTEIELGDCAHARLDVDSFLARVDASDPRIPELLRARDGCHQLGVPTVTRLEERPVEAPVREPKSDRLITKWWLWTAVGVVVVSGIVIIAASGGDDLTELPAISCNASGCR